METILFQTITGPEQEKGSQSLVTLDPGMCVYVLASPFWKCSLLSSAVIHTATSVQMLLPFVTLGKRPHLSCRLPTYRTEATVLPSRWVVA